MNCMQLIHRWPCLALMAMAGLWVAAQDAALPLPLTPTQLVRVRELVRVTQDQSTTLQARLAERQRELADLYAVFTLNESEAQRRQREIVGLQRELLANHHRLQVELRTLVSQERFDTLRRRLERMVDSGVTPTVPKPPTATASPRTP
jgi:hypothetical protein